MLADIEVARRGRGARLRARSSTTGPARSSSRRRDRAPHARHSGSRSSATSSSPPSRCAASRVAQRESIHEFATEMQPGLIAGQRLDPGERRRLLRADGPLRAHRVGLHEHRDREGRGRADRRRVLDAATRAQGIHPHVLYAMKVAGADVDHDARRRAGDRGAGLRALHRQAGRHHRRARATSSSPRRSGCCSARSASTCSPGRPKSRSSPTTSADPAIVAADLVGQAEHGHESPAWLFTTSRALAEDVMRRVPALIAALPPTARDAAGAAWRDYGEVIVCASREEAGAASDRYAPEHLEVHARDLDWWLARLTCYGSLFLGEETTVAFGDKASGPNHILPTKGAARYSGGLSVHKFIEDAHLAAHDARRQARDRAGDRAHLAAGRHGGARAHRRRSARASISPASASTRASRSHDVMMRPQQALSPTPTMTSQRFSRCRSRGAGHRRQLRHRRAIALALAEAGARVVLLAPPRAALDRNARGRSTPAAADARQ